MLGGVGRGRASVQGGAEDGLGAEQAGEGVGSRKVRAVEQREPFLRAEVERGKTRLLQRIGGGEALATNLDFANPDHCGGHMRQRRPSPATARSEENTSELQSLMRNSYAVFCLKKKKINQQRNR